MEVIVQLAENFSAAIPKGAPPSKMAKRPFGALDQTGFPTKAAGPLISALLASLGAPHADVTVVLPARLVRSRRIMLDIPVDGVVRQSHLTQGLSKLKAATETPGRAVLYRQPSGYMIDGRPGDGDPVSAHGDVLTIDASVICTDIRVLNKVERAVAAGGAQLVDVIPPQMALCAAVLPEDATGTIVHVAHGETIVASMLDHLLVKTATLPVGFRHLVADAMRVASVDISDAMAAIHTDARCVPRANLSAESQAIDARLCEIGEWVAMLLGDHCDNQPVWLSGVLTETTRLSHLWPNVSLAASPLSVKGPFAPLLGASAVLDGSFGAHDRASVTNSSLVLRGGDVVRWLRAHF